MINSSLSCSPSSLIVQRHRNDLAWTVVQPHFHGSTSVCTAAIGSWWGWGEVVRGCGTGFRRHRRGSDRQRTLTRGHGSGRWIFLHERRRRFRVRRQSYSIALGDAPRFGSQPIPCLFDGALPRAHLSFRFAATSTTAAHRGREARTPPGRRAKEAVHLTRTDHRMS